MRPTSLSVKRAEDLVPVSEEELERAIRIALQVTRSMYLSRVTGFEEKPITLSLSKGRKWAQDVIAYAVMRQLGNYTVLRDAEEYDRAGRAMLPLFSSESS